MLVVAAFGARGETGMAFDTDIFNSLRMNVIALAEVVGALFITQADFLRRPLGTVRLTGGQWGLALLRGRRAAPPGREAGKWTARRTTSARRAASAGSMTRIGNQTETAPMKTARTPRSYHT
jgi:hypothetical protein